MRNLHDTIDAKVWTKEWLKTITKNPNIPTDEETMIGWFANAIMAGYDAGMEAKEGDREDKSDPCVNCPTWDIPEACRFCKRK